MSISALLWMLHTFFKVCLVRVLLCVFALWMGDWFEVCLLCYFILYFSAWRSLYMACCDTQAHFTPLCFSSPVGLCRLSLRRNEGLTQFEQFAFNGCFLTRTDDPASFRLWSWNELPATFDCPSLLRACVGSPFACPWESGGGRNAGGTKPQCCAIRTHTMNERVARLCLEKGFFSRDAGPLCCSSKASRSTLVTLRHDQFWLNALCVCVVDPAFCFMRPSFSLPMFLSNAACRKISLQTRWQAMMLWIAGALNA